MDATMDVDMSFEHVLPQSQPVQLPRQDNPAATSTFSPNALKVDAQSTTVLQQRDNFKDIPVKVHIRRPERDSWVYVGRGMVTLEVSGHSSQVVVRSTSNNKILIRFSEGTELQAEKRGNFVVIGCVEGSKVVSWSLNALNNAETIRLLASIELACYRSKQAIGDPRSHHKSRRRVERAIKDDRRKRHRRRKEQEAMVEAFAKQDLNEKTPTPPRSVEP